MGLEPVLLGQFHRQFVNREVRLCTNPALYPTLEAGQLTTPRVPLRLWRKRSGFALKPHHIVDKLDRNTQPPRCFSMRVALLNKRNSPRAQLNRMRFAHL